VAAQRAAAAALIDGGGPLLSAVEAQARALKCSPLAAVAAQCTMHTVHTLHEEPHARRRRRTHSGALVKSNRIARRRKHVQLTHLPNVSTVLIPGGT